MGLGIAFPIPARLTVATSATAGGPSLLKVHRTPFTNVGGDGDDARPKGTAVEIRPSAWFEGGQWFKRVDSAKKDAASLNHASTETSLCSAALLRSPYLARAIAADLRRKQELRQ
jgi:hypothetical protein